MKALSYDDYQRLSEGGLSVPVFRELPGDLRTPVSAFFSLGARSGTRSRGSRSATARSSCRTTPARTRRRPA